MERHRRLLAGALAIASLGVVATTTPGASSAAPCPTIVSDEAFASADELRAGNAVMADLGPRPTASAAHESFIQWIEQRLDGIDGLERTQIDDTIHRQIETGATLSVAVDGVPQPVAVASPVPYARPAPDGVTAPVVYVPPGSALADAGNLNGRIVLRDAAAGTVPFPLFAAVAYLIYDPDSTFDLLGNFERDYIGAAQRITDLEVAAARGAAGILFVHDLPRAQVEGHYSPYPGVHFDVPALYVGADEGAIIRNAIARGDEVIATMQSTAVHDEAPTRTVVATLPGRSAERIVVQSHTDGMNAVWDNGPIAILALAEHFASLPIACRPRTIEFVFTTAHLHLSHSGAVRYATELDETYDSGTVAFVVALEHLGALEYEAVPRDDGGPGRELVATGQSEMFATFVMESPVLITELIDRVIARDLRRTVVLRGADAPTLAFPPHRSYGGEGGPYREHLIPTVAAITGPWTLFNPAFGLDELVDPVLMRRQTMAFGDLILAVDDVPREVLAGLDTVYRLGRDLLEQTPLSTLPTLPALPVN